MVSNSAGSSKDRGGIGAEALSMSLGVPVLAHRQPKPACAPDILAYFAGRLGPPRLTRDTEPTLREAAVEEENAEEELLSKWRWSVEQGPLCGTMPGGTLEERMVAAQYGVPPPGVESAEEQAAVKSAMETKSRAEMQEDAEEKVGETRPDLPLPGTEAAEGMDKVALHVLVVGDRQFTDVLLARRLELYDNVSAVAVLTTELPQPNDVRLLRKLEAWLSSGLLSAQAPRWAHFVRIDAPPPPSNDPVGLARLNPLAQARAAWERWTEDVPPVQLDPRSGTWRPKPLFVAAVRAAGRGLGVLGVFAGRGASAVWARIERGAKRGAVNVRHKVAEMRVERAKARAEAQAKAAATAEAEAEVATVKVVDGERSRIQSVQ